ncbi:hypothetical protein V2J09_016280, partial [Rumex salicifolius]
LRSNLFTSCFYAICLLQILQLSSPTIAVSLVRSWKMSIHKEIAKGDLLGKATKATEDLYIVRDTFFPVNPDAKISILKQDSDICLNLLDSVPPEQRKTPVQRATYEYLRGKILDVFLDYKKEAEDHLSKAVKLNPSLSDAWLCLGNCLWKKGDLSSAKNCFTMALSKGPNKNILCQLSMLERKMAQGAENEAELVDESIQYAKKAIALDVKDGNTWCKILYEATRKKCKNDMINYACCHFQFMSDNLGNACLTSFFVTGAWDYSKLLQSLKAYQNAVSFSVKSSLSFCTLLIRICSASRKTNLQSLSVKLFENVNREDNSNRDGNTGNRLLVIIATEKDERMKSNPDLFFNCATVNKYLENYERALSGFEAAASKDPGLNADQEVRKIVILLDKIENLLKGQSKAKRLAPIASLSPTASLNPSYKMARVDQLLDGLNKTVAVAGKVLFFVKHENTTPLYYIVCDPNKKCFVLSVYGMHDTAIKGGDQVTLLEPWHRSISFSWKGKLFWLYYTQHYEYKSIRVDFLEQLLVNGKPLSGQHAIRASIHAQHKPS